MSREAQTITVTELREHTRQILENAHFRGKRYGVERAGQPMALILGIDEFEQLMAVERTAPPHPPVDE